MFRTESLIHLLVWVGDGGFLTPPPLVPPAPLKPAPSDTLHLAPPPCIRSTALSHPIPSRTSNELEDPNSSLVAAVPPGRPQNPNQNLPSARCSPSGTGTRLLCIAVLPVRSRTAAPQCRSVLPRPRPRGATQNSMAVPAVLTFEAETGDVSVRSPHGAHQPKRPVGMNFSIGGEASGSRDAPLIGP